jgi:hypothetical protein
VSIVIKDGRPRLWSQGTFELVKAPARNPRGCYHTRPAGLVEVTGAVGA